MRKLSSVYTRIQSGAAAADRIFAYMDRRAARPAATATARALRRHHDRPSSSATSASPTSRAGRSSPTSTCTSAPARRSPWSARTAAARRRWSACAALLRPRPRLDPDRRPDIRTVNLRSLRQQIGIVTQETDPVRRHDLQQHRLRQPPGQPRRGRGGRPAGLRPRLHHQAAQRLPDARRRGGREAVRRPEAAPRPGAGDPARPEHPHPRRVHQPVRRRERGR